MNQLIVLFGMGLTYMSFVWMLWTVITVALWWLFLFRKLRILDRPGADIVPSRKPVPTMQWLVVYTIFVIIVSLFFSHWWMLPLFQWLFAWITILLVVTAIDEYLYIQWKKDLPAIIRLLAQVWAAIVAIWIWWIAMDEWIFQWVVLAVPFRVFAVFFVLWSLLCINAINRFDGVYGQASGVSSIGFLTIVLLLHMVVLPYYTSITPANAEILERVRDVASVFFIISLVYTIIEYKPYGLLRDLWTMMFGFVLAYISIVWWAKIGTLIVALSLVIFDAMWVWLHRIFFLKKNPLKWDYTHLHYRLLGLWWNKWEVRAFVWGRSLVMMILMLLQWPDRWGKVIVFVVMALVFFGVNGYLFWIKKLHCGIRVWAKK